MSATVLVAPPYIPPQPPLQPGWDRMIIDYISPDGDTVWHWSNPATGAFLMRGGMEGLLGDPPYTHQRDQRVTLPGSAYRGTTYGSRVANLKLYVYHDKGTIEFVALVDALMATLEPESQGTMVITIPGVRKRSINLRVNKISDTPDLDPSFFGWVQYDLEMQADDPFWRDDPQEFSWAAETQTDYFAVDPNVYYVSTGTDLSDAEIANTGDQPSYAIARFNGPFTSASLAIDGHLLEVPFAVASGAWVEFDPRPGYQTVVDNTGANRFADAGELDWAALPPRSTIPLTVVINGGAGSFEMLFTALNRRML